MRVAALDFTGTGNDLRRHLRRDRLVNLLLGGLYTSIVGRKQARYLAAHTTLDNTPLTWSEARRSRWPAGLLLMLFIVLRVAEEFGHGPPVPAVIAAGVLLLPFLWGVAAARRIDALGWRGLRCRFTATWPRIYRASWPLFVVGLPWAAAQPWVTASVQDSVPQASWFVPLAAVAALAYPLLVRQGYEWHRLRWNAVSIGGHALRSDPGFGPYLRLWLATTGLVLLSAVAPVLLLRHAVGVPFTPASPDDPASVVVPLVGAAIAFVLSTPARAWHEARMFGLWWDGGQVEGLARIACRLDAGAFVRLRTIALVQALASLGRSRSEAAIASWRTKLDSLAIQLDDDAPHPAAAGAKLAATAPSPAWRRNGGS